MTEPAPSDGILSDPLKAEIQDAYRAWLAARQFRPRRGQREMIAEIARTLTRADERIAVIEAGTGTGKTAAYCLAAIPVAMALGKTVVVSTATVALQEQVVLKDLPDLRQRSSLRFSFALAKGRRRYLCLKRLDDRIKYADSPELALFESPDATVDHGATYQSLLTAFAEGRWDGEIDSVPEPVADDAWRAVTTDHRGCSNNRCEFFRQCPFFRARNALEGSDVVVANHDLVLADLSLGGGVVLPDPADCIYVIDEAHHLPEKTQQHFSVSARLRATGIWLDQLQSAIGTMTQRFSRPDELIASANRVAELEGQAGQALADLAQALAELAFLPRDEDREIHRFPLGRVPEPVAAGAAALARPFATLCDELDRVYEMLAEVRDGKRGWERGFEADDWLPVVGQLQARAAATFALAEAYAGAGCRHPKAAECPDADGSAEAASTVAARWANRSGEELELVSAPIDPGPLLAGAFWSRCHAAILTSATLTAMGRFDRFLERVGLPDARATRIPSPFDFPRIARFVVPPMRTEPTDFQAHSEEIAELLPGLLGADNALVLFTSWRQMFAVRDRMPHSLAECLKVQGQGSKQALLEAHRVDVAAGRQSVLFGLASFAEGVDLPDELCRQVIIAKLPFSVPDDPLDEAMAEWAESRGRNPFYELAVPDAALKLVQACGRLIRHEEDWGSITLLDRRIVTRRYGRDLLASLPPYRLELAR